MVSSAYKLHSIVTLFIALPLFAIILYFIKKLQRYFKKKKDMEFNETMDSISKNNKRDNN